jgi:hypothetical protein
MIFSDESPKYRFCKVSSPGKSPLGLGISEEKKLFRGRRYKRNNCFVPAEFRLFRGTENSWNSIPNHSAEEKNARSSVPWNKNRSKLPEFHSQPFRGRETTRNSIPWNKNRCKLWEFHSEAVSEENILFAGAGFFL